MTPLVCSLKTDTPQLIPGGGGYHIVRFPYEVESIDAQDMHPQAQPDGARVSDWQTDDRSGLVWPTASGWGHLQAMIQWEAGDYTELRDRFIRDPFGAADTTATDHRPPSPGMQCFTKAWGIYVRPETPIALAVGHTSKAPVKLTLAEFKLIIHC
jgi:hypothetical protein